MSAMAIATKSQRKPLGDLRFRRTMDHHTIRRIITLPWIYLKSSDDGRVPADQFQPVMDRSIWYVLAYDGDELLGLLTFVPMNTITWNVHCALLPEAWGNSPEVLRKSFDWFWNLSPTICLRIEARVPAFNRLALRLAQKAGMMKCGETHESILWGSKRWNEIIFGVNRPEEV